MRVRDRREGLSELRLNRCKQNRGLVDIGRKSVRCEVTKEDMEDTAVVNSKSERRNRPGRVPGPSKDGAEKARSGNVGANAGQSKIPIPGGAPAGSELVRKVEHSVEKLRKQEGVFPDDRPDCDRWISHVKKTSLSSMSKRSGAL